MARIRINKIVHAAWIAAALLSIAFHSPVYAQEVIDKMGVEVLIERNQDLVVTESIYIRAKPRVRNFVRTLPKKFFVKQGFASVRYDFNFLYLHQRQEPFSVQDRGDHVRVSFGPQDAVYLGDLDFVLQYRVKGAMRVDKESAGLRLLIPGKWGVMVKSVEILFRLPKFMLADSARPEVTVVSYEPDSTPQPREVSWSTLKFDDEREGLSLNWARPLPPLTTLAVALEMPAEFFGESQGS